MQVPLSHWHFLMFSGCMILPPSPIFQSTLQLGCLYLLLSHHLHPLSSSALVPPPAWVTAMMRLSESRSARQAAVTSLRRGRPQGLVTK